MPERKNAGMKLSMQGFKYAGIQLCRYINMHVNKYASIQVFKFANWKVCNCKYANVKL